MAKQAEFIINGASVMAELKKVDRKKIYGWSTVEVFDENGSKCKLASISDGVHVLPSGSSSLIKFNDKGETVSSSDLVGFNQKGEKVEKVLADKKHVRKTLHLHSSAGNLWQGKTCPRCEPQRPQETSVRAMPWLWSVSVSTASSLTGSQKLGQPVPESYLVAERKRVAPQAAQAYVPSVFSST